MTTTPRESQDSPTPDAPPVASSAEASAPATAPAKVGKMARQVATVLFTREDRFPPHWGVTLVGIAAITFSVYLLVVMSHHDYSDRIICHAAMIGEPTLVEELITNDGGLRSARAGGLTVLHWGVVGGSLDVVKILIHHGADVNATGPQGITPLHIAAAEGRPRILSFLLEREARVNAPDQNGSTPLDWALGYEKKLTEKILREYGGKEEKPLPPRPQRMRKPEGVAAVTETEMRLSVLAFDRKPREERALPCAM